MSAGIEVEGLRALIRALEKAGASASDFKTASNRTGNIVAYAAKALAPKRSGALASSIRSASQKNKVVVRAGGARIPYAMVIHYGWPRRNIESQPFMTDALEQKRDQVMKQYQEELERIAAKIAASS